MWEHFDLVSPNKVQCLQCPVNLAYCNNTSSMLRHLRAKHPGLANPFAPNAEDAAACAAGRPAVVPHGMIAYTVLSCNGQQL